MQLFKQLYDLGFTPLNCVLLVGLATVWALAIRKDKKQTTVREEWHAETRQRVDAMQGHVEKCDEERANLREAHAELKGRIDQMSRCPLKDCPNRSS